MADTGIETASHGGYGRPGAREDPYLAFNFNVEIEGIIVGGFSEVTGLQVETEVQDYREGGENSFIHKLPGPTRYPTNLILKHGLVDRDTLWEWYAEITQGIVKRCTVTIFLMDTRQVAARWWHFKKAYPVKWTGPELRAGSNEVALESLELVHCGLLLRPS